MAVNNFDRIQEFAAAVEQNPDWPRAMCFGDSWFQYPPQRVDINKQLGRIFQKTFFFNESVAGRDSDMYRRGRGRVTDELRDYEFTALLLSMGGNDVVGKELQQYVKKTDEPQDFGTRDWGDIPQQVMDHIRLIRFEHGLGFIRADFTEMFQRCQGVRPDCEIFVHNYAYIWPSGKPFKLLGRKAGPWVKPFLDAVGLPNIDDQRVVTCWLLDQFTKLLNELAAEFQHIHVIDAREALPDKKSWDNEIHPKGPGFRKIAVDYWAPVLRGTLK